MTIVDTATLTTATLTLESPVDESPPDQSGRDYSIHDYSTGNKSRGKRGDSSALPKASNSPPLTTIMIPVDQIGPSPYNPRNDFDEAGLKALAKSIELEGQLHPIIVRDNADVSSAEEFGDHPTRYTIIAGERRWRAVQMIPLETIRAEVRKVSSDLEAAEITVSENFMRQGFNPIEEALAFRTLVRLGKKQVDIALMVGKTQSVVPKALGLLELPPSLQDLIAHRTLTASHGHLLRKYFQPGPADLGGNEDIILRTGFEAEAGGWTLSRTELHLRGLFPEMKDPDLGLDVTSEPAALTLTQYAGPGPDIAESLTFASFVTGELEDINPSLSVDSQAVDPDSQTTLDTVADFIANFEASEHVSEPEVLDAAVIDAPIIAQDVIEAEVVDTDPTDFDGRSPLVDAAPVSVPSASPAPPGPLSKAGDPTPVPKPQPQNVTASTASSTPKTETPKPAPAAPSLPAGWINAPIKEEAYAQARDMGLWPPTQAILAVQELNAEITSLRAEIAQMKTASYSAVLEDGFIRLGAIPLIAGRKLEEWNRTAGEEVLSPDDTVILHALHPDRDMTTLSMIAETLLVARLRNCRAKGLGDGEEMPDGLAEALTEINAQKD